MWRRLPLWTRAILIGLIVAGIPTFIWAVLAGVNLRFTPRLPWSVPIMAVVLWAYWRYLRSDATRSEQLRAHPLSTRVWRIALMAGGMGVAAVWALFGSLRGLLHIVNPTNDVSHFPLLVVFSVIVMASAVAGVAEESGFRGFMQLPLERAYGPATAIAITSVLFTAVHLTHGRPVLPFLPFYFIVAIVYSLLTYLTGSILPSMLLHFIGDVMTFGMRYLAAREGAVALATGKIAMTPLIAFVVFAALSAMMFRLLAHEREGRAISTVSFATATKA